MTSLNSTLILMFPSKVINYGFLKIHGYIDVSLLTRKLENKVKIVFHVFIDCYSVHDSLSESAGKVNHCECLKAINLFLTLETSSFLSITECKVEFINTVVSTPTFSSRSSLKPFLRLLPCIGVFKTTVKEDLHV